MNRLVIESLFECKLYREISDELKKEMMDYILDNLEGNYDIFSFLEWSSSNEEIMFLFDIWDNEMDKEWNEKNMPIAVIEINFKTGNIITGKDCG